MIKVYGIPNCDTVKKARAWLAEQGVATNSTTSRSRASPRTGSTPGWPPSAGKRLLNRRGPTWRARPALQAGVVDAASAKPVMVAHKA